MEDQSSLLTFGRHIPRTLRQQALCDLVKKYLSVDTNKVNTTTVSDSKPSIERFHGALLFVDISGFTALSQKLDVETLKNYINDYFSTMLSIVDKWDGDVVKFAGDALYIVWPTFVSGPSPNASSIPSPRRADLGEHAKFVKASQHQLEKAVACGLEISSVCGRYEVRVGVPKVKINESTSLVSRLLPIFGFGSGSKISPSTSTTSLGEAETAGEVLYLDVHTGVSAGMMASVDISFNHRSEFFLIGEPLVGVAMAESQANKGDVVMCPLSHDVLHSKHRLRQQQSGDEDDVFSSGSGPKVTVRSVQHRGDAETAEELPCGCLRTQNGLFRVCKMTASLHSGRPAMRKSRSKSKIFDANIADEQNKKLHGDVQEDIERALLSAQAEMKREFIVQLRACSNDSPSETTGLVRFSVRHTSAPSLLHANSQNSIRDLAREHSHARLPAKQDEDKKFAMFLRDHLKIHFNKWMNSMLVDFMARHVHEVERKFYSFTTEPEMRTVSVFNELAASVVKDVFLDPGSPLRVPMDSKSAGSPGLDDRVSAKVGAKKSGKNHRQAPQRQSVEAVGDAELRNVVVLFIKVDRFDLQLFVDNLPITDRRSRFLHNELPFLTRTDAERHADQTLLERFQACYAVLCGTIMEHGGQLRQFIVDDKGTVCIGTFGLRGSAAVDNAATAVEAARKIIQRLSSMDFSASIGITSGKAYCGLVGSTLRHEYAVMGPSTNLSARLMCKAPPNGIICDLDIKERDRTHKYHELQAVNAKGYAKPVMTFKPEFSEVSVSTKRNNSSIMMRSRTSTRLITTRKSIEFDSTPLNSPDGRMKNDLHPALEMMATAATSDFFVVESKTRGASLQTPGSSVQRLHGREEELTEIFNFLFAEDVASPQQLSYQDQTKMMAVSGPSGSGKTALVVAIEKKLSALSRSDRRCNVVTSMYRANVLNRDVPFSASRGVVTKLLRTVHRAVLHKDTRCALNIENVRASMDYSAIVEILWPHMPVELQGKKSALSLLVPVLGDIPEDEAGRRQASQWCVQVAAALITVIATSLKRLILIIIEDLNMLDSWSYQLVQCIWQHSRGVSVLATHNQDDDHKMPTQAEFDHGVDEGSAIDHYFSRCMDDGERFCILPLPPLSKEATLAMARESLEQAGNTSDLDAALQPLMEVYDASGGKPLYVVELLRSIVNQTVGEENLLNSPISPTNARQLMRRPSVAIGASYRIEEAICLRLDKLHLSLQILLKATAVACSYRDHVSFDMLSFILAGNRYFSSENTGKGSVAAMVPASGVLRRARLDVTSPIMENSDGEPPSLNRIEYVAHNAAALTATINSLPEALLELLQFDMFVCVHNRAAQELSLETVKAVEVEFSIPMEKNVISGLIVDDQREHFHERIALYLHARNLGSNTAVSLEEEGFHWEQASMWGRAMACFCSAAMLLRSVALSAQASVAITALSVTTRSPWEAHSKTLTAALQMYQHLENDAMATVSVEWALGDFVDDIFQFLLDDDPQHRSLIVAYAPLLEAVDRALEVVEGEVSLLLPAFRVHVQMARHLQREWAREQEVVGALQTALIMCVAVRLSEVDRLPGVAVPRPRSADRASAATDMIYTPQPDSLRRRDILELLSLCGTSAFALHPMDNPLAFSPHHLDIFSDPTDPTHDLEALQSRTLLALHFARNHRLHKAVHHIDHALALYGSQPGAKSAALVEAFGLDLVPYALAFVSQCTLLQADVAVGSQFWYRSLSLLHTGSLTDPLSAFVVVAAQMAVCNLVDDGRSAMLAALDGPALSVLLGPHLTRLFFLWLQLIAEGYNEDSQRPTAASMAAIVEELDDLEPQVANEVNGPRAAFLQVQGCSLHRVYAESYLVLFTALKESQLNVRIVNSLTPLMQLPTEPAGSSYLNVISVLVYLGAVAVESSGGVLVAVKERAEPVLLDLASVLLQRNKLLAAATLLDAVLLLPLHQSVRDAYEQLNAQAKTRLTRKRRHPSLSGTRSDSRESVVSQEDDTASVHSAHNSTSGSVQASGADEAAQQLMNRMLRRR